jgi:hypothetical protein
MRVARLDTGMVWAEDPPLRTRHLIANLEVAPLENGELRARPRSGVPLAPGDGRLRKSITTAGNAPEADFDRTRLAPGLRG